MKGSANGQMDRFNCHIFYWLHSCSFYGRLMWRMAVQFLRWQNDEERSQLFNACTGTRLANKQTNWQSCCMMKTQAWSHVSWLHKARMLWSGSQSTHDGVSQQFPQSQNKGTCWRPEVWQAHRLITDTVTSPRSQQYWCSKSIIRRSSWLQILFTNPGVDLVLHVLQHLFGSYDTPFSLDYSSDNVFVEVHWGFFDVSNANVCFLQNSLEDSNNIGITFSTKVQKDLGDNIMFFFNNHNDDIYLFGLYL